jgi:hypothetical protein
LAAAVPRASWCGSEQSEIRTERKCSRGAAGTGVRRFFLDRLTLQSEICRKLDISI